MNSNKYFCHSCDKRVDDATQEPTGEYVCRICKDPYVELLSETEEDEMVIEDYNPEADQVVEAEEAMEVEPVPQPEFRHSTFNFNFNVNINGQNVYSSSSSSSSNARSPQPYSFVGGDRTEVHMPSPPRRREPQPYSHVFVEPPQRPQRPEAPRRPRRQPPFMFQSMFVDLGDMRDFGFPRAARSGFGMPPHPQGLFGNVHFFGHPPMAGRGARGDYFQGDMNELLAQMHRQQQEAEHGKPPAAKSVIDMLPTSVLTKASADALAGSCCAVCQDTYKEGETVCKLPCGHEYHKDCVHPWLERHCTCPVCRHEVGEATQPEPASQAA